MYKIVNFILFLILVSHFLIANGYENFNSVTVDCSPQLQKYVEKILRVPESRELIASIQREGPLCIKVNDHRLSRQFGAFWDVDHRAICINLSSSATDGDIIGSIIFELHNAAANSKLKEIGRLAAQKILSRESYVRAIEHVEYENSLKAYKLAKKGVILGLFPTDACLPIYQSFEEYLHFQKIGGHFSWIANLYDRL